MWPVHATSTGEVALACLGRPPPGVPLVRRPGAITSHDRAALIGTLSVRVCGQRSQGPGLLFKAYPHHYVLNRPHARTALCWSTASIVTDFLWVHAHDHSAQSSDLLPSQQSGATPARTELSRRWLRDAVVRRGSGRNQEHYVVCQVGEDGDGIDACGGGQAQVKYSVPDGADVREPAPEALRSPITSTRTTSSSSFLLDEVTIAGDSDGSRTSGSDR